VVFSGWCRALAPDPAGNPREWEQWLTATRKAIRKHAVTVWGQAHRMNAPQRR
jgi:hypothetical protein